MIIHLKRLGGLALVLALTQIQASSAQVVERAGYNPYTGYGGRQAAGYNPYTGREVAGTNAYNPYTGSSASVQRAYNPYTGRSAYHYSYRR